MLFQERIEPLGIVGRDQRFKLLLMKGFHQAHGVPFPGRAHTVKKFSLNGSDASDINNL
jgi:hypothetical protein